MFSRVRVDRAPGSTETDRGSDQTSPRGVRLADNDITKKLALSADAKDGLPEPLNVLQILAARSFAAVDDAIVGGRQMLDRLAIAAVGGLQPPSVFVGRLVSLAGLAVFTKPGFGGLKCFDHRATRIGPRNQGVGKRSEGPLRERRRGGLGCRSSRGRRGGIAG